MATKKVQIIYPDAASALVAAQRFTHASTVCLVEVAVKGEMLEVTFAHSLMWERAAKVLQTIGNGFVEMAARLKGRAGSGAFR